MCIQLHGNSSFLTSHILTAMQCLHCTSTHDLCNCTFISQAIASMGWGIMGWGGGGGTCMLRGRGSFLGGVGGKNRGEGDGKERLLHK